MAGKNGAIKLVAGNSNPALAQQIADRLKVSTECRALADVVAHIQHVREVAGIDHVGERPGEDEDVAVGEECRGPSQDRHRPA